MCVVLCKKGRTERTCGTSHTQANTAEVNTQRIRADSSHSAMSADSKTRLWFLFGRYLRWVLNQQPSLAPDEHTEHSPGRLDFL